MSKLIYRINGGTTVVQASAMKAEGDLAYAIGFLANHRLYKMSKGKGVSAKNAQIVLNEMAEACERFNEEVVNVLTGEEEMTTISRLGKGEVTNPWNFVGK